MHVEGMDASIGGIRVSMEDFIDKFLFVVGEIENSSKKESTSSESSLIESNILKCCSLETL